MKDFTKFSIKEKLDKIEKRLEITEMISETVKNHPDDYGYAPTKTINGVLDSISSIIDQFNEIIKIDLSELKVFLHHLNALPIRNEKGELE